MSFPGALWLHGRHTAAMSSVDLNFNCVADMVDRRFCDDILSMIDGGKTHAGMTRLVEGLNSIQQSAPQLDAARRILRAHPLHAVLLEDPHTFRAFYKPRGYAGDAELIDFYYLREPPGDTSPRGQQMFSVSSGFPTSEAVRWRLGMAKSTLAEALTAKQRVCCLACGHFREADSASDGSTTIVGVDQDLLSLDHIRRRHGSRIQLEQANVIQYLKSAIRRGERFELIYSLGLTDYLNDRTLALLLRLMKGCLEPGGRIVLANFLPNHLGAGWLDACMDWRLIYRDEVDLNRHAKDFGLSMASVRDPTGNIVWCEMR